MRNTIKAPFRLALRVEGEWWIAYVAKHETMEGAMELARIRMSAAKIKPIKDAFMATMQLTISELIKESSGLDAVWPEAPKPAPESERSGRG